MSSLKKLIRNAIEDQNCFELEKLLRENPDFDLNNFTSNNLSALWIAICPSPPKSPSFDIINLLMGNQEIDPSQTYNGQTIRSYYSRLFHLDLTILDLLEDYENNYNHRQNDIVLEVDDRLRNFANHDQNVHTAVVEDSVKKCGANLYLRYAKTSEFNWLSPLSDLELWLELDGYDLNFEVPEEENIDKNTLYFTLNNKGLSYSCIDAKTKKIVSANILSQIKWNNPLTSAQLKPHISKILQAMTNQGTALKTLGLNLHSAKKSFNRILTLRRSYQCSSEVSLNGQQAMALAWLGISSANPADFVDHIDMSSNEVRDRKRLFIDTLINIQNEYGIDVTSCEGGTFNILISRLDCIHLDVKISESTPLNQEIISQKYLAFCKKNLQALLAEDPALFWHYIQYYPFGDLPIGINTSECYSEKSKKIVAFNDSTSAEFIKQIKKENQELMEEDRRTDRNPSMHMDKNELEQALINVTFMIEDSGLAFVNLIQINKLAYFYQEINRKSKAFFGFGSEIETQLIKDHMNTAMKSIMSKNPTDLELIFNDLVSSLADYPIDLFSLEKHLTPLSDSFGHFFDHLENSRKENFLKHFWSFYAKDLPRTPVDNQNDQIFWKLVKDDFFKDLSLLQEWLATMPENIAKDFIKLLIQKNYHLNYKNYSSEIYGLALNLALKEEHLLHFPLDEPLVFENQNLKGMDLSSINLQQITFKNCDLALTNILNNPTFNPEHIGTNFFDYAILSKVEDFIKENSKISLGNWLSISDKNVLILMEYLARKSYFQIANLIIQNYPDMKFYGNQGDKHLNSINVVPDINQLYESLRKVKFYFRKNVIGDEALRLNFSKAYRELADYINKRENENLIELSTAEKEKVRNTVKSLAHLINSLNFNELIDFPELPLHGDLETIGIDEELKGLLNQSTYAQIAAENNFLECILVNYYHNRLVNISITVDFICKMIAHPSLSINLFFYREGSHFNPFDLLVYSAALSGSNSSFTLLEHFLNIDNPNFSPKDLDMLRSQLFKAISKHAQTNNQNFNRLYNLFFTSKLFSLKDSNEWILNRIEFDKRFNYQYFISALFSGEFSNYFDEFSNKNPEVIQDCFEYCVNKIVQSPCFSLHSILSHKFCSIESLSFIKLKSMEYKHHLLNLICLSEEIKNKFLANKDLSNFIINNFQIEYLDDSALPEEWKFTNKREADFNNINTVHLSENLSTKIENNTQRITRFKAIYKALYEGQSSCFKHWNELVDAKDLTVEIIEKYVNDHPDSRSEKAWTLANNSKLSKDELFIETHQYSYAKSSSFLGLFRQSNFAKNYENMAAKIQQAEKGSRTETIDTLLKVL